jgi:hypothetical protein
MQLLCASSSIAFIHSLRIALDGEGIRNYMSDADRVFIGISAGPTVGGSARLYVLDEADWDKAVALMRMLDGSNDKQTVAPTLVKSRPLPKWLVGVIAAVVGASLLAVLGR